jgi:AraC family transcriptional activator of tynA and feaB
VRAQRGSIMKAQPEQSPNSFEAARDPGRTLSVSPFFGLLHTDTPAELERGARYDVYDMGGITAVRVAMPALRATRLPWDVGDAGHDDVQLAVLVSGKATVTMDEDTACMDPGDWVALDQQRACTWHMGAGVTLFGLQVPRSRLGRMKLPPMLASRGESVAAGEMSGIDGVMSTFLRTVEAQLAHISGEAAVLLSDAALGLLAAVFEEERRRSRVAPDHLALLRLRASRFVSANAADAELGVEGVARALNCSTRYLYKAFAGESLSPEKMIWNARLERSCQALLDPKNLHRPVGTIAFENGFNSDAHFARAFKASYGLPPGRFRLMAAALAQSTQSTQSAEPTAD